MTDDAPKSIAFSGVMTAYKFYEAVGDLYVTFFDGRRCYGDIKIKDMSGQAFAPQCEGNPSLFYRNGKSFVIYKDPNSNNLTGVGFDGLIWSDASSLFTDLTGTTGNPTFFQVGTDQYMAYESTQGDINICRFDDAAFKFKFAFAMYIASNYAGLPSFTVAPANWYTDDTYIFAVGIDANTNILLTRLSLTSGNVAEQSSLHVAGQDTWHADYTPTCIAIDGQIMVCFTDSHVSHHWEIYYCQVEKTFASDNYPLHTLGHPNSIYQSQYSPSLCYVTSDNQNATADFLLLLFRVWGSERYIFSGKYSQGTFTPQKALADYDWVRWQNGHTHPQTARMPNVCLAPPILVSLLSNESWMASLDPDLSLGSVNIPGSHDSGAIFDPWLGWSPKKAWTNQSLSLTEQLKAGVRLFDIRIGVYSGRVDKDYIDLKIVHGQWDPGQDFQPLGEAMQEFTAFLQRPASAREVLIISLQIDNWNYVGSKNVLDEIYNTIGLGNNNLFIQPVVKNGTYSWAIPTVGGAGGRIYPLSKIKNKGSDAIEGRFGVPMNWPDVDSKIGEGSLGQFSFGDTSTQNAYIQDVYNDIHISNKWNLVEQTMQRNDAVRINFVSCRLGGGIFTDANTLNGWALSYFGKSAAGQRGNPGWCLFDFCESEYRCKTNDSPSVYFEANVITAIILSNFGWNSPNHGSYWSRPFVRD